MMAKLKGKKIAILVENGFEEEELTKPRKALDDEGATTHIISPNDGKVKAWNHTDWGGEYNVDVKLEDAKPDDYDALVLPGGVLNPDKLRRNPQAIDFAKAFFEKDKLVAVICHGSQTLIETGLLNGRKMTAYHAVKTDVKNAGAEYYDEEVVIDRNLISSRNPGDIPAFNREIIENLAD
ncbi:MAG: type 1 glutamine amidotransferase [Bacteroidales bacterium]|nr:type 1 glutamine amidotransferase [Bacteroidales bacterium]MCF8343703.1 type 1 glutamine amidotransferase [Bacteroidales bacterium]MCF8352344.1 type 1 glutamine amidotransferase [Bacteroidales bacterium]MCF8377368.1 type 1 glutamine amidotransferase [Bacteroidales bacterium]MCF8401371.1 type 1 glutamine amidotransferase [Bacteroidales bacterium]